MISRRRVTTSTLKLKGKKLKALGQEAQKQLTQKQKSTSTKLSNLKEAVSRSNDSDNGADLPLRKRINRLTFLLSSRIVKSEQKDNFIAAIVLLNHALMTADYDESMALRLMNIAKRLARKS